MPSFQGCRRFFGCPQSFLQKLFNAFAIPEYYLIEYTLLAANNTMAIVELWLTKVGYAADPGGEISNDETAELLRRSKAGDLEAFEKILSLHERRIARTAWRLLHRTQDVEDAAQEVYLRLYKSLRRFDEGRELTPWLYRITVNVCRDFNRRGVKNSALSLDDLASIDPKAEAESSVSPYEQAAQRQEQVLIREALRSLPEKERAALVLRDHEGLSTREVARVLRSTETTVRSQISRARLKLKGARDRLLRRTP
jgi:RNA polymerase sigma-70 factor (ECF subfamily)